MSFTAVLAATSMTFLVFTVLIFNGLREGTISEESRLGTKFFAVVFLLLSLWSLTWAASRSASGWY